MNSFEALARLAHGQSSYEKRIPMIELFQIISKDLEKLQAIESADLSEEREKLYILSNYAVKGLTKYGELGKIYIKSENKAYTLQEFYEKIDNSLKKASALEDLVKSELTELKIKKENAKGFANIHKYINQIEILDKIQALLGDE